MHKFMSHEPLAAGLFNESYNAAKGQWAAWSAEFQNTEPVLQLFIKRLGIDYEQMTSKMRKPYSMKEMVSRFCLHPCWCGI